MTVRPFPTNLELDLERDAREIEDALAPGRASDDIHESDLGNARRLVRLHGDRLRYAPGVGWLIFDGKAWREDRTSAVESLARDVCRQLWSEVGEGRDEKARKRRAQFAAKSESASRIEAMIRLARSEPGITVMPDTFDADPWSLATPSGVVDLRTGSVRSARPDDLVSRLTGCTYDPAAECPTWRRFLLETMDGDAAMVDALQRAFGYAATGSTREQAMFVNFGKGANGKSTAQEAIAAALGEYAGTVMMRTLLVSRTGADASADYDLASLRSRRYVTATESAEGRRFDEELVKRLTGGDTIKARAPYREPIEFRPQFKLFLAVNALPRICGTDDGIWRRLRLVPWTVSFKGREDHTLPDRLHAELPGVLAWVVAGAVAWHRDGLNLPRQVAEATGAYRTAEDVVGRFVSECCTESPAVATTADRIYRAFLAWCEAEGERPMPKRAFGQRLAARGYSDKRTKSARLWVGVMPLDEPADVVRGDV